MSAKWTSEEIDFLQLYYSSHGPRWIGTQLDRTLGAVHHKGRKLGLYRGISEGRKACRNQWEFTQWSYELGYVVGVYLGDGNIWTKGHGDYFRLSVIDKDFALATQQMLENLTGFKASMQTKPPRTTKNKLQYTITFCNRDFVQWLKTEFGGAKEKRMPILEDPNAIRGLIEGFADSEGTFDEKRITIRVFMDLKPLVEMFSILDIQRLNTKGFRKGTPVLHKCSRYSENLKCHMYRVSISSKEWTKAGLGTYIQRKAKNIPWHNMYCGQDGTPNEI